MEGITKEKKSLSLLLLVGNVMDQSELSGLSLCVMLQFDPQYHTFCKKPSLVIYSAEENVYTFSKTE